MGKLVKLRNLHVDNCPWLKLPKTIGRLTNLQTLDRFDIYKNGGEGAKQVFKLSDLKNMDQLQGSLRLIFQEEWKDAASDADQAKLVNKKHLRLELVFWDYKTGSIMQEEILSALQPNPNLESLEIRHYSGTTVCPHWMNMSCLNNLRSLVIWDCGVCEFVPLSVFGNLGSLETLELNCMYKLKKVEFENSTTSSSLGQFPSLKCLQFSTNEEWEEWSDVDQESDCIAMPFLSTLTIKYCDKLKALPHFLRKTQPHKLTISSCVTLSESCKNKQGKEWPKIAHIPNIQIDGVWIQQEDPTRN